MFWGKTGVSGLSGSEYVQVVRVLTKFELYQNCVFVKNINVECGNIFFMQALDYRVQNGKK
jgi:hypothetical protein